MNNQLMNFIASAGGFFPMNLLRRGSEFPPFLPFYHIVRNQKPEYIDSYSIRTVDEFEKELDYLLGFFEPVDLNTILHSPDKRKMHLTFDDGLKECYSVIAPILKRKGIPATFFVSPNFVDNRELFHRFKRTILTQRGIIQSDRNKFFIHDSAHLDEIASESGISFSEYLGKYLPYMSLGEISSLKTDGFTIGSHSLNHPEFWILSEEEQYNQIEESMIWVVNHFQPEIKAFSFPFTDDGVKSSLFEKLKSNGVVDVTFGTAGLKYDQVSFNLQRIPVERKQNWSVRKVVHYEYFYYFVRSIFNSNRVLRK
jgi:peptidoglycan/xylan/chitin deacetylase (PgdA/CDA1 family)